MECSINVHAGHELEYTDLEKIDEKRHVVIVGGGPGGVEAARVLSLKGYDVSLFEKTNQLGGQLRLVSDPVYKKKMNWHCEYLTHEMKRLNVNVYLQTEATVEKITDLHPYAGHSSNWQSSPIYQKSKDIIFLMYVLMKGY